MSRFRRKGPLPFRHVIIITFILFMIFTVQGLWIINRGIEPSLMSIAETESMRLARQAINYSISKKITEDVEAEDLIEVVEDDQGRISTVGYNRKVVTDLLAKTTLRVQSYLDKIGEGEEPEIGVPPEIEIQTEPGKNETTGIIYEIPLGQATNNALLANLGPKVPVRFTAIGDVQSNISTDVTPYGINNMLLHISIHYEVNVKVVIPFSTKTAKVATDIPVDIRVIQGEVPYFYNSSDGGASPSFEMPVD